MKISRLRFIISLFAVALSLPLGATATTINFATIAPAGDMGTSSYVHLPTGLTVQGFYFDDASWLTTGANLYVRNDADDHGLGVCSQADDPPCPGPTSGGDFNELDNAGAPELIRLGLPAGYEWVSVQLSSLDTNDGSTPELGQLWADLNGTPPFAYPVAPNPIWQFAGGGPIEPTFLIPASAATAPYLFFEPTAWTGSNTNNDFLVYQVTINRRQVMEPGTLGILGIGLLALGRIRRKR